MKAAHTLVDPPLGGGRSAGGLSRHMYGIVVVLEGRVKE